MSRAEKKNDMEDVQLTQEDIKILSDYSWDMTGYTSRFGYFYLSSDRENVKGLTKWQAEHIFQLTPIPPGMEDALQDMENTRRIDKEKKNEIQKQNEAVADAYLLRALQEKNLLFLSFFLHGYEHRLNGKVYSFIRRNDMDPYDPVLFLDMKLALQELILKKLPTYDPSRDAKFLTYIHQFIYDAFIIFRMQQECWQMKSLDTYKTTRRMAATYNANDQDAAKAIEVFCSETGCTSETAEEYLVEAIGIRARQTEVIIDRDDNDTAIVEDIIPDGMGNLPHIIHSNRFGKAIRQSFEKLPWLDQTILKARNAICDDCGGVMPMKEQYSFREISLLNGTTTDKAGELAYHAAVDRLAAQLIEDEVIRIVDMKLKKVVRRKKKNAAATYLYQADCDGGWGEIYIDFENKYIKIQRLAEWDTTVSHIYAWQVIGFVVFKEEQLLPKK
ncbi:MAG: hypothetical protein IKA89_06935, partial [Anaerotignum sp.]|nr:hypothetical protein [Anaerotignum sp.]